MSRNQENTGFVCVHCAARIRPLSNGGYRNHCPFCLRSRHVDVVPGDRASACGGVMDPIGLRHRSGKGLQVRFRCRDCGTESVNRIAVDTVQPDDVEALAAVNGPGLRLPTRASSRPGPGGGRGPTDRSTPRPVDTPLSCEGADTVAA